MGYQVKCSGEFRTEGDQPLTASLELTVFIQSLPADAVLSPVLHDKGSQREPWRVLVGLRADWTEERR